MESKITKEKLEKTSMLNIKQSTFEHVMQMLNSIKENLKQIDTSGIESLFSISDEFSNIAQSKEVGANSNININNIAQNSNHFDEAKRMFKVPIIIK